LIGNQYVRQPFVKNISRYLISNYHAVKDATKVRLLTGAKGKGRRQNEE
jgi:hypothetical protein